MEESEHKRQITAITSPVLDALDEAYSTPCEGTGIFPLQATLNHSCVPNVTLLKEGEDEEDGRVVARTSRYVAAGSLALCSKCQDVCGHSCVFLPGEELCNAYCNVDLPLADRQRELREYGFVCGCPRCEQESSQPVPSEGKRRLK